MTTTAMDNLATTDPYLPPATVFPIESKLVGWLRADETDKEGRELTLDTPAIDHFSNECMPPSSLSSSVLSLYGS